MVDRVRVGSRQFIQFDMRLDGIDALVKGWMLDNERKMLQVLNSAQEAAMEVLRKAIQDTFDAGIGPKLAQPTADLTGKSADQTLVTTGKMRDAVQVSVVRSGKNALFQVGLPEPYASRHRQNEFGPTVIPLTDARRALLRHMGFNIGDNKHFVIVPRRPVFQIAMQNPRVLRRMMREYESRVRRAFRV